MLTRLVESCSRRCAPNPSVSPTALYIRPNERRRWSLPFISGRTLDTHFGTGLSFDRWRRLSYLIPFLSTVLVSYLSLTAVHSKGKALMPYLPLLPLHVVPFSK